MSVSGYAQQIHYKADTDLFDKGEDGHNRSIIGDADASTEGDMHEEPTRSVGEADLATREKCLTDQIVVSEKHLLDHFTMEATNPIVVLEEVTPSTR